MATSKGARRVNKTKSSSWIYSDIEMLSLFITRTEMFVHPVNRDTIVSFVSGYQAGRGERFDFDTPLKLLMADKYKTYYSSDGWPGQIERYAKKKSIGWVMAFSRIMIELIGGQAPNDRAQRKAGKIFRSGIESLIARIQESGDPWFNDSWTEDWMSLCLVSDKWFRTLWTEGEWLVIKAIDMAVRREKVFVEGSYLPRPALVKLRDRYISESN